MKDVFFSENFGILGLDSQKNLNYFLTFASDSGKDPDLDPIGQNILESDPRFFVNLDLQHSFMFKFFLSGISCYP